MEKFNVTGMSCASCVSAVERAVLTVDGVKTCSVNLLTNSMEVEGGQSEKIISAVKSAGYGASVAGKKDAKPSVLDDKETPKLLKIFFVSLGILLPLMYISMGHTMWHWPLPPFLAQNPVAIGIVEMLLSGIILVINQRFFINGARGLIKRTPNMGTLVSLGSLTSYIYSIVMLIMMSNEVVKGTEQAMANASAYLHSLYFESAAMVLVLITLGKTLEAYSKGKTTNAIKALISLKPQTATVLVDGAEKEVLASSLSLGDIFIVRAGQTVPTDGEIIEGDGAFDESILTGESIPQDKSSGQEIYQSTISKSGYVLARATRVGEDTSLSKIIKTVENASSSKAPIAKIADRVSGVFVPAVLLCAIITTIVWLIVNGNVENALVHGISVLVVSCPCSLGLATPVAIMVGNGVGARGGILFKSAEALEQTGKAEIVILDKTGTITKGKPEVTDVISLSEINNDELIKYAYSIEKLSEHPLAKAICTHLEGKISQPYEAKDFRTHAGSGVSATINNQKILCGSYKFIGSPREQRDVFESLASQGKTPIFIKINDTCQGVFALQDTVKDDSAKAIEELKQMGIYTVMLTGDNQLSAKAIAESVKVDKVIAGVLPEGKKEAIENLMAYGSCAMIGDGINDAPALATANIGIAIGAGADVAIDAASVVLTKSSLSDAVRAIKLSRATYNNICQNLFWAFIYNCIAIAVAIGVFTPLGFTLSPMIGALAMSLSSVSVVLNALRLNLFNDKYKYKRKVRINFDKLSTQVEEKEEKEVEFMLNVEGMQCSHCEASVERAVGAMAGVKAVKADRTQNQVWVQASLEADVNDIIAVIEDLGFSASV